MRDDYDPETGELSDPPPRSYSQLTLPTFDGITVDQFVIRFSGKVPLSLGFDVDDEFREQCKMGRRLRLTIDAVVVGRPFGLSMKPPQNVHAGAKLLVESIQLDNAEVIE